MDPKLHRRFLRIADGISPALKAKLAAAGPVWFPEREDKGAAAFLARAIVGQKLSTKAARSIWARVEAAALASSLVLPALFHDTHTETLRGCGLSRNKVKALSAIRAAHEAGLLESDHLRALDHPARSARLIDIWGVGPWTCDMLAIFYCRDPDVWPAGDLAAVQTMRRLIGRRSVNKAATEFAPHRSILALYMWKIADTMI